MPDDELVALMEAYESQVDEKAAIEEVPTTSFKNEMMLILEYHMKEESSSSASPNNSPNPPLRRSPTPPGGRTPTPPCGIRGC